MFIILCLYWLGKNEDAYPKGVCIIENGSKQTHSSGTISISSGYLSTQK